MKAIAVGKGLYLKPYKTGFELFLKPYVGSWLRKKKIEENLPTRAISNFDNLKYAKKLRIPHFRGVFMCKELPSDGPRHEERMVINLDDSSSSGSHWVAFKKRGDNVVYFDSFGDLQPPLDVMLYLEVNKVKYNTHR